MLWNNLAIFFLAHKSRFYDVGRLGESLSVSSVSSPDSKMCFNLFQHLVMWMFEVRVLFVRMVRTWFRAPNLIFSFIIQYIFAGVFIGKSEIYDLHSSMNIFLASLCARTSSTFELAFVNPNFWESFAMTSKYIKIIIVGLKHCWKTEVFCFCRIKLLKEKPIQ